MADLLKALEDTEWLIDAANGTGVITDVDRSRTPIIRFAEGGGFSGNTGCNSFFGTLRIEGSTISMGPIGSTMMMCPEPLMEQERAVLGALEAARGVSIDADDLMLTDADGTPVLTATRAAP